jgi:hypothetical protein
LSQGNTALKEQVKLVNPDGPGKNCQAM